MSAPTRLLPHRLRLAFTGWCIWMCRTWKDEAGTLQRHWYRWGADGEERFDCSGFVLHGASLFGARDLSKTWYCDRMWKAPEWRRLHLHQLEPGDLVFYGSEKANHVMVWMGDGSVVGASGGNEATTDDMVARARNAFVKHRPAYNYRPDVLGFKRHEPLAAACLLPTYVPPKESA